MANIITILEKEIEKKNLYIDEKGNTIQADKLETIAKKSYLNDLKCGNIPFSMSFEQYHATMLESYLPVTALLDVVKDTVKYHVDDITDVMPTPEETMETTDTVAN